LAGPTATLVPHDVLELPAAAFAAVDEDAVDDDAVDDDVVDEHAAATSATATALASAIHVCLPRDVSPLLRPFMHRSFVLDCCCL
jgi:hypothetical protein